MRTWIVVIGVLWSWVVVAAKPQLEWHSLFKFPGRGTVSCTDVIPLDDGGYLLAAQAGIRWDEQNRVVYDAWLIRTDARGDCVSSRIYGGSQYNEVSFAIPVSDNRFVLGGTTEPAEKSEGVTSDGWLMCVDANGDSVWSKTIGGEFGEGFDAYCPTADGGYLFAGSLVWYGSDSTDSGWDCDVWLVKTDNSFNVEWTRRYGGLFSDRAKDVVQTEDRGFLIAIETQSFGNAIWLLRTDSQGDSVSSSFLRARYHEFASDLLPMGNDQYILAGGASSDTVTSMDVRLWGLDAQGDSLWCRSFGRTGFDYCSGAVRLSDGGLLLACGTHAADSPRGIGWMIRTDAQYDSLWSITDQKGVRTSFSVAKPTPGGGFIVAGECHLPGDTSDVILLEKFSPE
ncbi:hypothetical protein EHM69_05135 [candidate division KSB1 bacterium]|nr:MAG: hypothetical protein EHM69_05135 [candidate division KSB1 bacterium]